MMSLFNAGKVAGGILFSLLVIPFMLFVVSPASSANSGNEERGEAQEPASESADNSGALLKCIAADGGVSYSNGNVPGFCSGGQVERVGGSNFTVIGAQPATVLERREESQRRSNRYEAYRPALPQPSRQGAGTRDTSVLCERYESALERVRSRMRIGYKADQYNGMMDQERRAKEGIAKYCK